MFLYIKIFSNSTADAFSEIFSPDSPGRSASFVRHKGTVKRYACKLRCFFKGKRQLLAAAFLYICPKRAIFAHKRLPFCVLHNVFRTGTPLKL